jgi:CRP/FNR family cyclic AMP-dependent transcriptional regulator
MAMDNGTLAVFEKGELIFREGEKADVMYIMKEGAVELKKHGDKGETLLRTVQTANDFFGEMALIDGKPRSASAVAVEHSVCFVVNGPTFESLIANNGKFAIKVIKMLSERIRRTNIQLKEFADLDPKERISRGIVDFALHQGEKASGEARYVQYDDMGAWLNGHIGVSRDEVDAAVFRLVKMGTLSFSGPRGKERELLLVPGDFMREFDRRRS